MNTIQGFAVCNSRAPHVFSILDRTVFNSLEDAQAFRRMIESKLHIPTWIFPISLYMDAHAHAEAVYVTRQDLRNDTIIFRTEALKKLLPAIEGKFEDDAYIEIDQHHVTGE